MTRMRGRFRAEFKKRAALDTPQATMARLGVHLNQVRVWKPGLLRTFTGCCRNREQISAAGARRRYGIFTPRTASGQRAGSFSSCAGALSRTGRVTQAAAGIWIFLIRIYGRKSHSSFVRESAVRSCCWIRTISRNPQGSKTAHIRRRNHAQMSLLFSQCRLTLSNL